MEAVVSPWLQHWQRRPQAQVRLFCFPYAGGGASIFRTWSEYVPSTMEICPVQLPGRENRLLEKPFSQMSALIEGMASALLPFLDMPYAFFGHSMGALIAFELARYLRRGRYPLEPVHLFASGHRAPQLVDPDPPTYHLPEAEFVEELRRLKGTPEEVLQDTELLRLLFPLLRADFAVCETYLYTQEEPLTCNLSAFGGICDTEVPRDALVAWQEQTSGIFTLRFFASDHFFVSREQAALLQLILKDLLEHLH